MEEDGEKGTYKKRGEKVKATKDPKICAYCDNESGVITNRVIVSSFLCILFFVLGLSWSRLGEFTHELYAHRVLVKLKPGDIIKLNTGSCNDYCVVHRYEIFRAEDFTPLEDYPGFLTSISKINVTILHTHLDLNTALTPQYDWGLADVEAQEAEVNIVYPLIRVKNLRD